MYTLHLVRTTIQQDRAETIHNLEPCLTDPIESKSRLESRIRDLQSLSFRLEVLSLISGVYVSGKRLADYFVCEYLKTEDVILITTASNTGTTLHPGVV